MKAENMLLKQKMSLLQLAEQLNNIRHVCNIFSVSRQFYYKIKHSYENIVLKD